MTETPEKPELSTTIFEIIEWTNGLALRHCMDHQPTSDPQIKKDIDELVFSFKLKAVTTGLCEPCYDIRTEEINKMPDESQD